MAFQTQSVIGEGVFPDLSMDSHAFKCYKAPIITKYRIANQAQTVYNPENPQKAGGQTAIKGSVILTGIQGEEWPIAPDRFYETYEIKQALSSLNGYDGNGLCAKRKIIVHAMQLQKDTKVRVSWGNALLSGRTGDYLVQYELGEYGRTYTNHSKF